MNGSSPMWTNRRSAGTACTSKGRASRRCRSQSGADQRSGVSSIEILVATALLATVITGIGRLAHTTHQGLRDRELAARLHWEIVNAREQVGTWAADQITAARIEALPFSPALTTQLDGLRWQAQVHTITEPATALQVTLAIHCMVESQAAEPATLTFWVPSPAPPE